MFEDNSLKIRLYAWTILLFSLGTAAGYFRFDGLAFLLWALGALVAIHVLVVSLIRERRNFIDSETNKLEEQRKLYEKVTSMTPEEKYIFGLTYVPPEVTVKVDKTAVEGNEFSQTWKKIPLAPYKLKTVAQAALNGEGFTVRKWVGDDEHPGLLTRKEWDAVHDSMEQLGMLEPNTSDPRGGFSWTAFGEDVLAQIVKDTL